MSTEPLLRELERVAEVPDATESFRSFIVELALRGDLTASDPVRLRAEPVNLDHILQGMEPLVHSRPRYRWAKRSLAPSPQFEPPQGWLATELANTGLYINGIAFKPSDWGISGRPIIRIQNLSGLNRDYNYATGDFPDDNLVNTGDLLVSWSATLDTYLWEGPQGVVNQHIFKVIPNLNAVTPRFLYWLLKHEVRQLAKSQHAHGLAMMHINRGPFLGHVVLLPSLVEQHRIVAKVEELMALCDQLELAQKEQEAQRDALRSVSLYRMTSTEGTSELRKDFEFFLESSQRLITKAEHVASIRQTIRHLAVTGRLMNVGADSSHERKPIRRVASLQNGYAFKSEWFQSSGIRLLRNVNVGHGDVEWASQVCLPESMAEEFARFSLAEGDIVVSLDRPFITTGTKVAIVREHDLPCLLLQRVGRFQLDEERLDARYLFLWVQSPSFSLQIDPGRSNGVPHVSSKQIEGAELALPSLEEQRRIVAEVDLLMKVCTELESALALAQSERVRLLESLLHSVLSGTSPQIALVGTYSSQQSAQ